MKYKKGDKVRIRKDLNENEFYGGIRCNPNMSELKGQIVTIKSFGVRGLGYTIDLDDKSCVWTDEMFEGLAEYTYKDLKNAPLGTKVTFENGEVLIKDGKYTIENVSNTRNLNNYSSFEDCFGTLGSIKKIEEPTYTTVYKAKVEILDKKEREYLSNVIKPFKNRIISITKLKRCNKLSEFISILYEEKDMNYHIILPDFEPDAMYRRMEIDKEYSLEELGL